MEQNVTAALLFSLIAGLSTSIGSLMVFLTKKRSTRFLSFSLGFSAGVMILISAADLLPESAASIRPSLGETGAGLLAVTALAIGILIAAAMDRVIPEQPQHFPDRSGILRVGIVSAAAIVLHNIPEGIATFMAGYHSVSLGLPIALAVALHNIPEGIAVAVPVYYGTGSRGKAFLCAALSGLSEPFGALLCYLILAPFLTDTMLGVVFGAVAGIMLYISFSELLPASRRDGHTRVSLAGVLCGMGVMFFGLQLF